jgi:predicted Zn finger-like uncharacterized protein
MATVTTSCPECKKQIKVPAEVVGKKIKCKNCGHVFAAGATSIKSADPDAKDKAGAPAIYKPVVDEEEGDGKPYEVTDLDLTPRCPHCANEMEADDIVCLHCGYNTVTRQRAPRRRVKDVTGEDWFWWLLPSILCILLFFTCIGWMMTRIIVYITIGEDLKKDFATQTDPMLTPCVPCCYLWQCIFCLWIMWLTGKFAFKRLVFHFRPPEQEMH